MDVIQYKPNAQFPFDQIKLLTPRSMQGGSFFSKIVMDQGAPLLFQTPQCLTKGGVIKTDKKTYSDLMFSENHEDFIDWFQELEKKLHGLIFEKRDQWFHNDMTLDDIEYLFNSSIRTYKTNNFLIRCFVQQPKYIKSKSTLQVYDENETPLKLDDVTKDKKIISIVEVLGIKFTNGGQSFHMDLCIRQVMVFSKKSIFNRCMIQINNDEITAVETEDESDKLEEIKSSNEKEESVIKEKESEIKPDKEDEKEDQQEEEKPETEEEKEEEVKESDNQPLPEDAEQEEEEKPVIKEKDEIGIKVDFLDDENDQGQKPKLISKESLEDLAIEELQISDGRDSIQLNKPKDVYYKMWREARKKAKEAKQKAIQAYLEAKKIKNTYLLDGLENSEDDDLDSFYDSDESE